MRTLTILTLIAAMTLSVFAADTTTATPAAPAAPAVSANTTTPATDANEWLNVETVTVEAANGDPLAQYTLAWLSDTGTANVPKDPDKARELYAKAKEGLEKAAKEGDARAAKALSHMYAEGKGVEKDAVKAAEYQACADKCKKDCCPGKDDRKKDCCPSKDDCKKGDKHDKKCGSKCD